MRRPTLATIVLAPLVVAAVGAQDKCALCHPESRVAFERSIHAREGVTCADCHGGDPSSIVSERAHRGSGFRSLTDRRQGPELCAGCHADLDKMRPFNLPIDQYALYLTSQHGRAIAAGDRRAAVCSDCHGAHDVLDAEDPRSPTHARNLAHTCAVCHSDVDLMAEYGQSPRVVDEYLEGLHGRALLEKGNPQAPSCSSCHGVHGATPPGAGDIDKVCGSCHQHVREAFRDGPHLEGMLAAGLPECESCHGNHAIGREEVADLAELCAECHDDGSAETALGAKLQALVETATAEVDEAEAMTLKAATFPLDVEDHLSRIEGARTYLTEAALRLHSVRLEPVEQAARRARALGEEVRHELFTRLDRRPAHLVLVVVWFYLLMTLAILFVAKRRLARSRGAA